MPDVRRPAVAGTWYPAASDELAREVDERLAAVPVHEPRCPRALVAPHAGLIYSGGVAAHAYTLVTPCAYAAVVLVGPSHFVGFRGVSVWPRGAWKTPLGDVPVAAALAEAIAAESAEIVEYPAAHGREHALELQLPFVARLLPGCPIVPLVMGHQTRKTTAALGDALARAVTAHERHAGKVLLVASTDLSHYEDAAVAARMDGIVLRHVEQLDAAGLMNTLEHDPRHACGGGPLVSVLRAAIALGAREARVLHYGDSGDVSGDKTSVVGYMAGALW